ncbi:hypothetical protein TrRE_jg12873 [Triparma retinervis]|uniref:NAD(P)-binding domain-containing protein n=1 Tax=Triparma retinervis TaxID=2557542 RepID=A0A9W6ZQ01_9STRA|nr:hypothetical protein TrRE_jg12873 [Triparma retinervis]
MFGPSYTPETSPTTGYLTNVPSYPSPSFGPASCKGSLRLLLADKSSISPVLSSVDAIIFCGDALGPPVPTPVAESLLESCENLKAVAALSRTMNEEGYGLFATAARAAANKDVWDNNARDRSRLLSFESSLRSGAKSAKAGLCIVRAGTLKGGGQGGDESSGEEWALDGAFYEAVQRDVVNFQMLHDCETSGAYVMRGDTGRGGGNMQVVKANSVKEEVGDTGRKGAAGALVWGLGKEGEWTVRAKEGRNTPVGREAWEELFENGGEGYGK